MTRVAIIGAGLAGTACAYVLKQRGCDPVLYEAGPSIASEASGNPLGLYNPRLSAEYTPESAYFIHAFNLALETFPNLADIDWHQCGSLHLITNEKKEIRFPKTLENWRWKEDRMQLLSPEDASHIAGIDIPHSALYLPQAGCISPRKLCESYARDIEIHTNTAIHSLETVKADAIILACGTKTLDFVPTLPLKSVRGQITQVEASAISTALKTNLCYGGYCSPAINGVHTIGATFQRWLDHTSIIEKDDQDNIDKLAQITSILPSPPIIGHRAGVRTTSKDHFPVAGKIAGKVVQNIPELSGQENIYVSTAHGSHGILSTLASAHWLADLITNHSPALSGETREKLSPARFYL